MSRVLLRHLRPQQWTVFGLDFFIVVIGVFVGIQVANWNDERQASARERGYLNALQEDFDVVIKELEQGIERYTELANAMSFLLEQSRMEQPDASLDAINDAVGELLGMQGTPIVSATYENLTGSGDLAIIKNQDLKNAMASFFGWSAVIDLVANTHALQLVSIFQPYVIANLDYVVTLPFDPDFAAIDPFAPELALTVLRTSQFRNVVAAKWAIVTDLRYLIILALEDARSTNNLLTEELQI